MMRVASRHFIICTVTLLFALPVLFWLCLTILNQYQNKDNYVRTFSTHRTSMSGSDTETSVIENEHYDDTYYYHRQSLIQNCKQDDEECEQFRTLLSNWPQDKPKAAIYIMGRDVELKEEFPTLITSLDKYFNKKFKYPIIIFSENFTKSQEDTIRKSSSSDIYLQTVDFKIPEFINESISEMLSMGKCRSFRFGYRHMCRFQSKLIYEQPIMKDLDYYWRLDTDSVILSDIQYDVFQFMKTHSYKYGSRFITTDPQDCVHGLYDQVWSYIQRNQIKTTFLHTLLERTIYYNNFEISSMSFWMSKAYARYIEFIDRSKGIFYYRWGDAPIKSIAVAIFIRSEQTHLFADIGYEHKRLSLVKNARN